MRDHQHPSHSISPLYKGISEENVRDRLLFHSVRVGTEIGKYLQKNNIGVTNLGGDLIWQAATAKLQISEN